MPSSDESNLFRNLDEYRTYLAFLARLQIGGQLRGKVDSSDIVQETLLKAHAAFEQFRGTTDAELRGWLRPILANTIYDMIRRFGEGGKRDVAREMSIQATIANSAAQLELWLDDQQSSPSSQAVRNEQLQKLADCLDRLPQDQQTAVELRHLHGYTVPQVADAMSRSRPAAAGLLRRGLEQLRQCLAQESADS